MAALRSSMAFPRKSTDRGARHSMLNGPSAGGMGPEKAGGGLVGQQPAGGREDDAAAAALGQPVGHEPVRRRPPDDAPAGAERQHGRLPLPAGAVADPVAALGPGPRRGAGDGPTG